MRSRPSDPSAAGRHYAFAAVAAIVTAAAIVAVHRESFRTLVSAHGLLHTAIAQRFASAVPVERPDNPFFAGEPLPYYWFYHYVAARLGAILGVHPLRAFELLGLCAVFLVWFAGAAIGRRLHWSSGKSLAIGFLALAGANAFGALILVGKLAAGRPWPTDDGAYLWGLTHPVLGLPRFNDPGVLYGPLINFFLNNSSRALALSLVLVTVLALLRYLEGARLSTWGALVAASAAGTAFSPIIGLPFAMVASGALACEWLRASRGTPAAVLRDSIPLRAGAALVSGTVLAAPTYYHLFRRSAEPEIIVGLRVDLIATLLVSGGLLVALAAIALVRLRAERPFLGMLTGGALALIAGNSVLRMPGANESNLFHVAAFMLAVPAAGGLGAVEWKGSGVLVGWSAAALRGALITLMASTAAVVLWAYWARPPIPLSLSGRSLARSPADAVRSKLYEWVAASTPPDAVFVADTTLPPPPVGNTPEFPAMTGRCLFVADQPDYIVDPQPDAGRRRRMAAVMLEGKALEPADRAYLAALQRPVFLMIQDASDDVLSSLGLLYGDPAFRSEGVVVFRLPG